VAKPRPIVVLDTSVFLKDAMGLDPAAVRLEYDFSVELRARRY
jgi:hypothetical protein